MKTINVKEETKKARKQQKKVNDHLKSMIKKVEQQNKENNILLNSLKDIQKPFDNLMDDTSSPKQKSIAFLYIIKYFMIMDEKMDAYWLNLEKYALRYGKFGEAMSELIKLDVINILDESMGENGELQLFENPEEAYNTFKNSADGNEWNNDL